MTTTMLHIILGIVWTHFLADFVLQTRQMAESKSFSNKWLGLHALIYTCPFIWVGIPYAIINGILHFIIDWATSRLTSQFWLERKTTLFFIVIGFDQAVHISCLFITYYILFISAGL